MTRFTGSDDLRDAEFIDADLHGARFDRSDLSEVVMRGVDIEGADIDSPWLLEDDDATLLINGVDVAPLVEAELNHRFRGRALRRATDPARLQMAWAAVEGAWATTVERVRAMPAGTVDVSVAGEWSFAQTLRHLVMATDTWLGSAILDREHPYHPHGLANYEYEPDGNDMSAFATTPPTYPEVLEARSDRVAMVREYLATLTEAQLSQPHPNPWSPDRQESTLRCLHTILNEEWEHHRYAVRDLDTIRARMAGRWYL